MTELKESIVECMYDSMEQYERSDLYQIDMLRISERSQELKSLLSKKERKLLVELLDAINDSDRLYAEEAYFCGVKDALKENR